MAVKLNSTGGGSVTLDSPSTASNYTITLPSAAGTLATTTGTLASPTITGTVAGGATYTSPTLTGASITAANSNTVEATSGPTSSQLAGNRNKIINGAMQVWQRGTSFSGNGYGPDRWYLNVAGTTTFTQETSVIPSGAQYALKWTTGAASSYGQVRQWLEQLNVIPLRGLTVTASAMVQLGPSFSGTLAFEIGSCPTTDATSGSYTAVSTTQTGTPTSSGYTKITATFTVPSNAVGLYIGVVPTAAQASGVYCYQTQIQLEPGATATPFENRLYGAELALCQRYYAKMTQLSGSYTAFAAGWGLGAGTSAWMWIKYPVTMRASPTFAQNNLLIGNATASPAATGFGANGCGSDSANIVVTCASGLSQNVLYTLLANVSATDSYISMSAEL